MFRARFGRGAYIVPKFDLLQHPNPDNIYFYSDSITSNGIHLEHSSEAVIFVVDFYDLCGGYRTR